MEPPGNPQALSATAVNYGDRNSFTHQHYNPERLLHSATIATSKWQEVKVKMEELWSGEWTPLCTETCLHVLQESAMALAAHAPSQAGEEVRCGECGRSYKKRAQLRSHMRRHKGTRPFACTACPRAFARSDELGRHLRSHSGDKPYPCSLCQKRFYRSDHLAKHMRVHGKSLPANQPHGGSDLFTRSLSESNRS